MKTYEINITVFMQAENADDALETLGVEMDYLCGSDNELVAVEYPPVSEVKEERVKWGVAAWDGN